MNRSGVSAGEGDFDLQKSKYDVGKRRYYACKNDFLVDIANILECSLDYLVLENIVETQETNYNQEFINIMKSCTTHEKRILIEILYAVRKILKENP